MGDSNDMNAKDPACIDPFPVILILVKPNPDFVSFILHV